MPASRRPAARPPRRRPPITIRRARLDDALRIRNLHVRSIRVLCREEYTKRQIAAWSGGRKPRDYRRAMTAGGERMVVAEDGERLAGFASLRGDEVLAVYVHPRCARRGVGTRLLAAAESRARRRGVRRLYLDATLTGVPFYLVRGYRSVRQHAVLRNGIAIPVVQMMKTLG